MQSRFILISSYSALFFSLFSFNLPLLLLADDSAPPADDRPTRTIPGGPRNTGDLQRDPPLHHRTPTRTIPGGPRNIEFKAPPANLYPLPLEERGGGGFRGSRCVQDNKPLTALIPQESANLTTANFPTWFFYIPQNSAKNAVFRLVDEEDKEIYQTNVEIPHKPGVISVSIPPTSTSSKLAVGKSYSWYFSLVCDPEDLSKNEFVGGVTQRIAPSPDLVTKLKNAKTMFDRANIYAQAGIWQETLTILAQLRRDNPNNSDLAKIWANLLQQVGLKEIAEEPLAPNPQSPVPTSP